MKKLAKITLLALVLTGTSSCALLSKAEIKAGYDNMITNIENGIKENNAPFDNNDYAKKSILKIDESDDLSGTVNKSGFYLGIAYGDISISDKLGLQPEINFIGIKDFNQIQVPILIRYNFIPKFNAYAGPNLGYLFDMPNELNSFNFALDLGLSYDITNKLLIEARYDWGITNLLNDGDSNNSIKLNNFQIGLAYRLGK